MADVILVDDDGAVRNVLLRLVEGQGHEVREAADGRAAMRLMREQAADVVISDIYMPEMDGLEVLMSMQAEFPGIRIVIMSGGGSIKTGSVLDIATTLGARAVLAKPVADADLRAAIAAALA